MVPTTTAPSAGAPMDNGATSETKTMNGKNALFMALVTGMAKEAKRKKMAKNDEREPTQEASIATGGAANSERDAALQVNDIPSIPSRTANACRVIKATAQLSEPSPQLHPPSSQRTPLPPPAPVDSSRSIHTPSPGRYHKMLSINKLGKEEPQHQIHAKAFREKAYIGPARKMIPETPQAAAEEEPKQVITKAPVAIKCEDTFFAELKHRAALQSVTQSLLAENKETAEHVAIISTNDDVSALGSKSFESEHVSVQIACNSAQILQRPPAQVELLVKPVELPVKYLDVLPDDEKKDIVITNMKEFKAPLPFDEDGKVSRQEIGEVKAVQTTVNKVEQQVDKVVTSVKEEAESQAPIDPPSSSNKDDANTQVSAKSDANTKATITSAKSNTSHKSLKPKVDGHDDDDIRSFKSLPATFGARSYVSFRRNFKEVLDKYGPKGDAMGVVVEENAVEEVAVDATKEPNSPKITTIEKIEANDLDNDDATAAISIKEITICSSMRGDRSTALASINSKIEHQTRKLAELEAETLRKHKEAETAATDARQALERMLEAKSKDRIKKIDYPKQAQTASDVDGKEPPKGAPKSSKRDGEDYKSIASRSRCDGSVKRSEVTSKQLAAKGDGDANFSLCSTWSEDDVRSTTKAASKSKGKQNVDCDYQSMSSSKVSDKRNAPKEARGELIHKKSSFYSDASSSQYSRSFDDSSRGSNETDSNDEDASDASNASTYTSSYKEDRKISEIRKKHSKKSYQKPSTSRSETRGRQRSQSGIATQRSKSASPVELARKKTPFLPSLMSPDPPLTKQGKSSLQNGGLRPSHRSRSQPRMKSSNKLSAKSDVLLSTTKGTNKPNHLLSYTSSRRSTETPQPTRATAIQSGISPETLQPVFARHKSAPYEHSSYMLRSGGTPAARQPSFGGIGAAPISLAGYTSGTSVPMMHPQMGVPPQQQCAQHYQYTPNSVPSAPISLAGYTRKEEPSFPTHNNIPMRPTAGNMGHYSTGMYPATNFSQSAGMQTPQQTSTYATRPNTTGQMNHAQGTQYTQYPSQQQHVSFLNAANSGRVNQYSMPYGGELL